MNYYTINEVAMMTSLTTRTLRNYIKTGLLDGEKIDGVWKFTEEDLSKFISNPTVKPSIQAKHKALVFDFLADDFKKENNICTILDLYVSEEESKDASDFFCSKINGADCQNLKFSFDRSGKHSRIILSGPEDAVMKILEAYYNN